MTAKAAAAVVSAVFAGLVLMGRPKRPANQFLAAFLLLIAGNQTAEIFRSLATTAAEATLWFRVATVFAAFDPFVLYYFASVYPERNELNRPGRVGLVLGSSAVLALLAPWVRPVFTAHPFSYYYQFTWATFTAIVYSVVLVRVLRDLVGGTASPERRLLYPALCVATLPTWPRVAEWVSFVLRGIANHPDARIFDLVLPGATAAALLVGFLVVAFRVRVAPSVRRALVAGPLIAGTLSLVSNAPRLAAVARRLDWFHLTVPAWFPPHEIHVTVRWLIFGALASTTIIRHQMLGMSLTTRRRAARVLVTMGLLGVALTLTTTSFPVPGMDSDLLDPGDILVLAVVFALSTGFRRFVDGAASAIYGVPRSGDVAASIDVYRAGVEQTLAEGRDPRSDPLLGRLRDELGLDVRTAGVVERMVGATDHGPLAPGVLVAGRYRVGEFLGRGGGGRAFRARDELLGRDVVIKEVLHDTPEQTARALHEARAAGNLDHPNIVTVFDVIQRRGSSLIITEYLSGGSLGSRLSADGTIPLDEALPLFDGVLSALAAVHDQGIVHCDLKPSNILLDEQGRPHVGDFGTSRTVVDGTLGTVGPVVVEGTPAYMAPEQRDGVRPTAAADIYAVGTMMWRSIGGPLPRNVERVIERAIAEAPGERWPSAAAMRAALQVPSTVARGTTGSTAPLR